MPENVFLRRASGYDDPALAAVVAELLDATGLDAGRGTRVLVKPNLVAPRNAGLSCTAPVVVRAVCRHLLDAGASVTVADSPAFGTGRIMARLTGLTEALRDLPVRIASLDSPQPVRLSFGGCVGISKLALTAERIVNVPRLKCHDQMGMTLAVKNFFGCVCGFRKSLAHQRLGQAGNRFARMILEVCAALPPSVTLLDGVVAMHKAGPVGGAPFSLGLLAAAANPVALDTALYALLGLPEALIPLWREARAMRLPGADASELAYPLESPDAFDVTGFETPKNLAPLAFHPKRFVTGRIRSLMTRLR